VFSEYKDDNFDGMCCNYGHPNRIEPICFIQKPLFPRKVTASSQQSEF